MFAFGNEQRPQLGRTKHQFSPGPGTYREKEITGRDGPSLTMSPMYRDKFKEKKDKLVPGPGQYDGTADLKQAAPRYGFGTSQREDPAKANTTKGLVTDAGLYQP